MKYTEIVLRFMDIDTVQQLLEAADYARESLARGLITDDAVVEWSKEFEGFLIRDNYDISA